MRNPLADKVVQVKPSGIRKFFDIVSEIASFISLTMSKNLRIPDGGIVTIVSDNGFLTE